MQLLPLLLLLQGQWNVDKMHQSLTFLRGNTFFCSWQTASSRHTNRTAPFLHYIEHSWINVIWVFWKLLVCPSFEFFFANSKQCQWSSLALMQNGNQTLVLLLQFFLFLENSVLFFGFSFKIVHKNLTHCCCSRITCINTFSLLPCLLLPKKCSSRKCYRILQA